MIVLARYCHCSAQRTCHKMVCERCYQYAGDYRLRPLVARRQQQRQQLGFIADFGERNHQRRSQESFQACSIEGEGAMIPGTR